MNIKRIFTEEELEKIQSEYEAVKDRVQILVTLIITKTYGEIFMIPRHWKDVLVTEFGSAGIRKIYAKIDYCGWGDHESETITFPSEWLTCEDPVPLLIFHCEKIIAEQKAKKVEQERLFAIKVKERERAEYERLKAEYEKDPK